MDNNNTHAGALPSNAGDDFHLLWAAQKILDILKPNSNLASVTVEGPAWKDSIVADLDDSKLYAIDLAEYYGGENLQTATKIVFSQLKYSTYMGNRVWTVASLCHSDNKKKDNSIIRRLADTYKEYTEKYVDSQNKLTIKLVSNRSISDSLKNGIVEAKKLLLDKKYKQTSSLIKNLPKEFRAEIEKISQESKLNSTVFLGFIKVLNFEDCGTATRSIQKAEIIQQLGNWGIDSLQNKYNEIIMSLRDRMMPERNANVPMTKDFVCSLFGGNYNRFFPAPTNIPSLEKGYIHRECVHDLIKIIMTQGNNPILVHSTAGIGKTTLVNNLKSYLPDGSAEVFYDCYGGGTYLQPADSRYEYDTAILQICNSLALECKTDFLLERRLKESDFLQELCTRLEYAVKYVKSFSEKAIVLLIIDAADNGIFAAQKNGKVCFVNKILQQPLPKGVKLLLTYRTEHTNYFSFPDNSVFFEVPPFSLGESSEHIRFFYPSAADDVILEFHKLSKRIPRVQAYVLASKQETPHKAIDMLRPNGKNTEDLFTDILKEIRLRYGEKSDEVSLIFGILINLPRPIPIEIATKILCCSPELLHSLSVDCSFGLYIENDYIYFRDEDFETFLRDRYCDNPKAVSTIADYMYQHRHQEAYCAKHVHSFIAQQTNISKILNIALEESIDESLVDITEASRIMISRIKAALGMPEMKTEEYRMTSFQLIYKIIDFSKSDEAIYKLIQNNAELAYAHCDKNTLLKIFTTDKNDFDSLGKAVLVFSMEPSLESKALSYLDSYKGAIHFYYSKPEEQRNPVQRPHIDDIVNVSESYLRLKDETHMRQWVTSWTRKKFQANVLFEVLVRLINRDDLHLANKTQKIYWPSHCKLSIVAAYLKCRKTPPVGLTEYLIRVFNRIQMINLDVFDQDYLILFLEYLCKQGNDKMLLSIISKYRINYRVPYLPYIHGEDEHEIDCNIRFYVLEKALKKEKVNSDDFLDLDGLNKRFKQREITEHTKDIKKVYNLLLPAYKYRIQILNGENTKATETLYKDCLANLDRLYWGDRDIQKTGSVRLCLLTLADSILNIPDMDFHTVHTHLTKISKITKIHRDTKLALSDLCTYDRRAHQFTLEILKSVSDELLQYPVSAMEASEAYIQCAQIGQKVENSVGQTYFEKALQAAKGLDYESYRKLELFNVLSNVAANTSYLTDVELSHEFMRLAEDYYRKMGDSKNYPHKEVFETATRLCPMNIFSVVCRQDDRNDFDHFSLPESAFYVLQELLKLNIYQPDMIASLATILLPEQPSDYFDLVRQLLPKFSEASIVVQQKGVEILIHDTLYNTPLIYKASLAKEIMTYINNHQLFNCKSGPQIKSLHDFICSIDHQDDKKQRVKTGKKDSDAPDIHSLVHTIPPSDAIQLVECLKKLDPNIQPKYVNSWLASSLPESFVTNLNILLEACLKGNYTIACTEILDVLIVYMNKWSIWPSVDAWRNNANFQRKIFVENMKEILISYHDYYDKLNRIFNIQLDDILAFFMEYLILEDNVPGENVIQILKKISAPLPSDFANAALKWCISTEAPSVHPLSGDQPFSSTFSQIDEDFLPISKLLWRMLGHSDKKFRWTAAHIIQNIYSCGHLSVIDNFITLYDAPLDSRYMDRNNFFFIDSARVNFLLVCLRIFLEEPQNGAAYYSFFKEIACSKQTIHALQRRVARQISLRIAEKNYPNDIQELLTCDEMKCGKTKKAPSYARASYPSKQKFRFNFDYMDTLPYWYNDVANIFCLALEEVAKVCDIYIHQFGIDNNKTQTWRDNFLHYNRYRNRNTHNSHGTLPEIETLSKYAEWHAMFYVADQYRCTLPYSEDVYHSYHDWLDSYLPGYQGYWRSEYRDYIPFIPFLWEYKKYKNPENEHEYMIPPNLIQSLIINDNNIVSYLGYYSSFDQSSQRVNIKSALINEKNINKLVGELTKPHSIIEDYYFEPDPEERKYRKKATVTIWPMHVDVGALRDDHLDRHDPFAKDVDTNIFSFSEQILKFCGYEHLNAALFSLPAKNKQLPLRITKWSEPSEEGGITKQGTYGSIAEIETKKCLEFLESIKKALIFEYSITFKDQTNHFYGTPSKTAKAKGIFVIRSNGTIESHALEPDSDTFYE